MICFRCGSCSSLLIQNNSLSSRQHKLLNTHLWWVLWMCDLEVAAYETYGVVCSGYECCYHEQTLITWSTLWLLCLSSMSNTGLSSDGWMKRAKCCRYTHSRNMSAFIQPVGWATTMLLLGESIMNRSFMRIPGNINIEGIKYLLAQMKNNRAMVLPLSSYVNFPFCLFLFTGITFKFSWTHEILVLSALKILLMRMHVSHLKGQQLSLCQCIQEFSVWVQETLP